MKKLVLFAAIASVVAFSACKKQAQETPAVDEAGSAVEETSSSTPVNEEAPAAAPAEEAPAAE